MVERFHRDMKAALRSRLNGPNWVDELPWVLLGLRKAPKEDIHTSAAEMVYGTPLTVPGDCVGPSDDPVAAAELFRNLRDEVLKLRPTPVLQHGTAVSHVPNNIMSTDYFSFDMMRIVDLCTAFTMAPIILSSARTSHLY